MTPQRASGALRLAVLLTVLGCSTGKAASLFYITTSKTPYTSSYCSGFVPTNGAGFFTPSDQKVYIFIIVTDLGTTASMQALVYQPGGQLWATIQYPSAFSYGLNCFPSESVDISKATSFGLWSIQILVNGQQIGQTQFTLSNGNPTGPKIPGTNLQIDFYNSTDPQYQLSDDEINQVLQALSQYPPSQLAYLKILQVIPSPEPYNPHAAGDANSDTAFLGVPSLQTRTDSTVDYISGIGLELEYLTWNNLTPAQLQEWNSIPAQYGQDEFDFIYSIWHTASAGLLNTLQTDTSGDLIRAAFFMAALFTDWQTDLIYLYTSPPGNTAPPQMTTARVTLTPALWAFGNYQLFLSGNTIIGYQIGSADPVYWSKSSAPPLPSMVVSHLSTLSASCTPTALAFISAFGTTAPANEACSVTTSVSGVGVTATAATTSGGNWLQASLKPATSPSVLTVSVDAAGLAPGSYDGSITLSAFGAANMTIPVALTVLDPNTQVKAAGGDAQTGAAGKALPSPLVVQVTGSGGAPLAGVPVAFAVTSGAATLSASSVPTGSDGTARVTVTLGSSPGAVTVTATVAGLPSIQFHLTAVLPPTFATAGVVNAASNQPLLAPGALATVYGANFNPPATTFTNTTGTTTSGGVPVGVQPGTSVTYTQGCNFVVPAGSDLIFAGGSYVASFGSGTNSVNVALYADSNGKPGSLLESINLVNALTPTVAVAPFSSAASPTLLAGRQYWLVVSMANPNTSTSYWWFPSKADPGLTAQSLNGGPWGVNSSNRLGFTILASPKAGGLPLPTSLGGVTVSLGGRMAPLLFVGASQANFQVPYEMPPGTSTMVVTANGVAGSPASVSVAAAAPGIFVYGNNWAVVLNQDYSLNGPSNPARAGSYVMLYGTGAGAASPAVPTGGAAPASPLSTVTNVTATVNGVPATVAFQGLAPGFVGLLQLNLQVPALPSGTYPVQIAAGGVKSNSAWIAVSP